jgi:hypothetical protein
MTEVQTTQATGDAMSTAGISSIADLQITPARALALHMVCLANDPALCQRGADGERVIHTNDAITLVVYESGKLRGLVVAWSQREPTRSVTIGHIENGAFVDVIASGERAITEIANPGAIS